MTFVTQRIGCASDRQTGPCDSGCSGGCATTKPTIAVVDDDETICDSLRWLLESAGYAVSCFGSAREFLDTSLKSRPACVLVDLDMPRITGIEFVPLLRRRYLDIPIIFITVDGDGRLTKPAALLDPAGIFSKPLDTDALLACIQQVMTDNC